MSYTQQKVLAAVVTIAVFLLGLAAAGAGARRLPPGRRRTPLLLRTLLGADGRLSTSRAVALAWTVVVTYILVALIIADPDDWTKALANLSPTYLLLLGFPYASLILAKATVASRVASGSLVKPASDEPGRLAQLFADDSGNPDVFDVQYVVFNVVAVVFVVVAFGRAGLTSGFPEIPTGLLLLTGGPAAVYVSNKFMPGTAPAIFSVSPAEVRVGQTFTVTGQNLVPPTAGAAAPTVRVGAVDAATVRAHSTTSLVVVAPDTGADLARVVDVAVEGADGGRTSIGAALTVRGRVPQLYGADRGAARVGTDVVLFGDWDDAEAARLTVLLDSGVVAPARRSPAAGRLTFTVPALPDLAKGRAVPVQVALGTERSAPVAVTIS